MKALFIEPFAGISGNMLLGALMDAGVPFAYLEKEFAKLKLGEYTLIHKSVNKSGIQAMNTNMSMTMSTNMSMTMSTSMNMSMTMSTSIIMTMTMSTIITICTAICTTSRPSSMRPTWTPA